MCYADFLVWFSESEGIVVRTSKALIVSPPLSPSFHTLPASDSYTVSLSLSLSLALSLSLYKTQKRVQREIVRFAHTQIFVNRRGLMRNILIPSKLEEDLLYIFS